MPSPIFDSQIDAQRHRLRAVVFASLALLLPLVSSPRVAVAGGVAANDARAAAKAKLVDGAERLKRRDFQGALERFEEAHALVPSPKIQYNFGLAYMGLGRHADAIRAFDKFLAEASDASAETSANARRYRAELAIKVGRLSVHADVDGASVVVDGRSYGKTPLTEDLILDPGPHLLLVEKKETDRSFTRSFQATAGGRLTIEAKLAAPVAPPPSPPPIVMEKEIPAPARPPAPAPEAPPPRLLAAEPPADRAPPPASASTSSWKGPVAWVTGAVGAVLLGVGGYESYVKDQKYNQFNSAHCDKSNLGSGASTCSSLLDAGNSAQQVAVVSFVAGGGLAVVSAVFFIWRAAESPSPSATETALRCVPSPTSVGGTCAWRF